MIFEIQSYLQFLKSSQNQHGLHSPFMYDLVTKCFYDRSERPEYEIIKKYRNDLLRNKDLITINDFGAGSKVFQSNERPVFSIAKNAGITLHRAKLLSRLTNYLKVKNALELGTSLGIASAAIAANNDVHLTTIEGCPETAKIAQHQFEKYNLPIELKISEFEHVLKKDNFQYKKFDLIFIDADKPNYVNYFNLVIDKLNSGGIIISDNVLWHGKVVEPLNPNDESTKTVMKFNSLLNNDERLETLMLPIRDGLSISRKK